MKRRFECAGSASESKQSRRLAVGRVRHPPTPQLSLHPSTCPTIVNQFWYDASAGKRKSATLSPTAALSARTFLNHGCTVRLWVYQAEMTNVPEGVQVRDAGKVLPKETFARVCDGGDESHSLHKRVAVASDVFRLVLMGGEHGFDGGENEDGGGAWWFDTDMLCLRTPGLRPEGDDEVLFASCPAKRTGSMASKRTECAAAAASVSVSASNPAAGWDGRDHFTFAAFYVPRARHPAIVDAAKRALALVKGGEEAKAGDSKKRHYTAFMWMTLDTLKDHGLAHRVAPPVRFSPLLWWSMVRNTRAGSDGGFQTYGTTQPSVQEILERSTTVQLYGSKKEVRTVLDDRSLLGERSALKLLLDEVDEADEASKRE